MATTLSPVPDFGITVQRNGLVRLFETRAPSLTILCAAAGYGKSVLAGQFARSERFEAVHWASFDGHIVGSDDLLAHLSQSLAAQDRVQDDVVSTTLPVAPLTRADAVLSLRAALRSLRHRSVCLVIDGLDRISDLASLRLLSELLQESTAATSRLAVTCRALDAALGNAHAGVWLVDEQDLMFRSDEARQLLELVGEQPPDKSVVDRLLERSGGQPALIDLLARHPQLLADSWDGVPQDLVWHVESVVANLTDAELSALYAAALLGDGSIAEVSTLCGLAQSQWMRLSLVVPLLGITAHESTGRITFRVHALLGDVLSASAANRLAQHDLKRLRGLVLAILRGRADHARVVSVLARHCEQGELLENVDAHGSVLLRAVGSVALGHLLDLLPAAEIAARPRLLLLAAAVMREQECLDEALERATIARALADCNSDWAVFVDASLLVGRIALDKGDLSAAAAAVGPLLADQGHSVAPHSRCLIHAYMAVFESQAGRIASARHHVEVVNELLDRLDPTSEAAVFSINCVVGVQGVSLGNWSAAAATLQRTVRLRGLTPVQALLLRANHAAALLEIGRLGQCTKALDRVLHEAEECAIRTMRAYVSGTLAEVHATTGDSTKAVQLHEDAVALLAALGDDNALAVEESYWSMTSRGCGLGHLSLEAAESAVAAAGRGQGAGTLTAGLAQVEVAASLLSLGDVASAVNRLEQVRPLFAAAEARYHLLRTDMVLAEAERASGDYAGAVERLRASSDYILSESSNWQIAMYIRAFPGLLPAIAEAVGPAMVPVHIVRMIPEPYAAVCLQVAKEHLDNAAFRELARRFDHATSPEAIASEGRCTAPCYVRLFGGLEVTTEYGVVAESSWSKRKARLMFAMLAARRGQEIPRDVLLERLWPEMDEDRARNNYYVMWSAMKQALACGGKAGLAAKYVGNAGGLCRITPLVRCDLDDFEDALRSLLAAEGAGHGPGVLAAAQEISDLYRGELLPGDIYDDWFTDMRDRYRHDFCDAMLSAAAVAERAGDFARGVTFVRRALTYDPWREDLYQTAIRCQMQAGQRSGAIEMYFSCRNKLSDDLGIDPSFETQRLYENVLAMEDAPTDGSQNQSEE